MSKKLVAFALLFFCISPMLMAQLKPVSGTVTDSKNEPVANATVTVKGTTRITQTNMKGVYTIQAQKGEVIVVSSIGMKTYEYKVGENSVINSRMQTDESTLQEVTVTAMDIKRNKRELGYSAQSVEGEVIKESQRENFINGLAGRVAGLTINPTSGVAGASSGIVLRGFNSLSLSNQPLFVVDGVIIKGAGKSSTMNLDQASFVG